MGSSTLPRPWGPEGVQPTVRLLMTVGHTVEGPVNLPNSRKGRPPTLERESRGLG